MSTSLRTSVPPALRRLPLSPSNENITHLTLMQDLLLAPPYQRGSVWGAQRQANLWLSLLSGIHVGIIVLSVRDDAEATVAVVDGKQRIEAARALFDGSLSVPSWWFPEQALTIERSTDGVANWDDLTDLGRRLCQRAMLAVQRVEGLDEDGERDLFDLINFGGLPQGQSDT